MKLRCSLFGHDWDSDYDPKCRRCGHELADDLSYIPELGGNVYMGWGRYGYVSPRGWFNS
jgi:hypothetical protein